LMTSPSMSWLCSSCWWGFNFEPRRLMTGSKPSTWWRWD
jgi:hypothetical protein